MDRSDRQAPLWLLPASSVELPSLEKRHATATYTLFAIALAALVPAFIIAPESTWLPHDAFTILFAAGFACAAAATAVRRVLIADSTTVPALVGVTLFGPLAAACIFAAAEAVNVFREPKSDQPLLSVMVNLTLAGWGCLVAGLFLNAVGFAAPVTESEPLLYVAVFAAGLLMVAVNTTVLIGVSVLYDNIDLQVLFRSVGKTILLPDIAQSLIAGIVLWAYFAFGIPGLVVPLVAVVLMPRAVGRLIDQQPVSRLDLAGATAHYASLLAGVLGISRHNRRVLANASTQMG